MNDSEKYSRLKYSLKSEYLLPPEDASLL